MQEFDLGENQRRDLGRDEDLELMIDHDEDHQERQLKNKILFSMQGLGGVRTIKRQDRILQAYIKGPHCEESVKDLVKFIKRDSPISPKSKLILTEYNIIQTDLLQLLIIQVQDKKLSFWIIALLALLTSKPSDQLLPDQTQKIMDSLRQYKHSFIKHECFSILMVHIADYYKTPETERLRAHHQMIEFIIFLIRNLVQIPNSSKHPNLHNHFLASFIKEDMFNPILYIIQTDRSQLMGKIDIPLMEIFYHIFTCLEPSYIYGIKENSLKQNLTEYKSSKKSIGVRHSRFLPIFQVKSQRGMKKITHKLGLQPEVDFQNQRKLPRKMADYKKVVSLQSDQFTQNFMKIQLQVENGKYKSIGEIIFQMTRQFLEVELEQLIKLVFDHIFKESSKVTEENIIQYMLLCSWCLQVVKAKYNKQRLEAVNDIQKDRVEFNLSWVVEIMQNAHFEFIYKIIFRETTREKKSLFKINMYHAGLKLFNSYLDIISILSYSMNMNQRKNANILMSNMFRHDIAKVLRYGFISINHEGITSLLISISYKFFKLLSNYSEGKVLTIKTNKLLKRKKKNKKQSNEQEQYALMMNNSQDEGENKSEQQGKDYENNEQYQKYQERKYNEKTQFAILAQYPIISKYLIFMKNDSFLTNSKEQNDAIFYYFYQIKKLLNGQWLFFQAQTMCTFQKILANHEWAKANKENYKLIQSICSSYIKLLRKNPLAIIQSLFRYSSLSLKDQIFKNYEDDFAYTGQNEVNMFTDE